jgi:DivIVA domain-containing protein
MAIDLSPRFTLSLRGYDKDEVDDYLESLAAHASDADGALLSARDRMRQLEAEIQRLSARVAELEDAIRGEVPHTVKAIGERITLILGEAEAGAAEALALAQGQAQGMVEEAQREADSLRRQAAAAAAEAREVRDSAVRTAEEHGARVEAEAKARATAIINEAEARARRRQAQIEGWAQDVITATQADQAQMAEEFTVIRRRHESEVGELVAQRDDVVATLRTLQAALGRAVERQPSLTTAGRETAPPVEHEDVSLQPPLPTLTPYDRDDELPAAG